MHPTKDQEFSARLFVSMNECYMIEFLMHCFSNSKAHTNLLLSANSEFLIQDVWDRPGVVPRLTISQVVMGDRRCWPLHPSLSSKILKNSLIQQPEEC